MKEVLTLLGFVCLCVVCIVLWIAVNFSTSAVIFMIGGFVLIAAYCGTDSSDWYNSLPEPLVLDYYA